MQPALFIRIEVPGNALLTSPVCAIKPETRNTGKKNGGGQFAKAMMLRDLGLGQTAASGPRYGPEPVDLIGWNWI
jgi:hypothetical protein